MRTGATTLQQVQVHIRIRYASACSEHTYLGQAAATSTGVPAQHEGANPQYQHNTTKFAVA